jgi:hypothetical protein
MEVCEDREVPLDVIKQGLTDNDWVVRLAAMKVCKGREVPLDVIKQGLTDRYCDVRAAAMKACEGRDVPLDVIKQGLTDDDCDVRAAAMKACKKNGLPIPHFRTFEPPKRVYKKCLLGVIVVAEIPADAQVRGSFGDKCRADKAKIVGVIGNVAGVQVGISVYDHRTTYFVGDEIEIPDFDPSFNECSQGFHFFCSEREARAYSGISANYSLIS